MITKILEYEILKFVCPYCNLEFEKKIAMGINKKNDYISLDNCVQCKCKNLIPLSKGVKK